MTMPAVDPRPRKFSVTPTVTVGAYSANDVIGGTLTFHRVHSGRLQSITITDANAQSVDYVLVLFDSVPTTIADNATFDIADADIPNIIYTNSADLTAASNRRAFTDNSITAKYGLDVPLRSNEPAGALYGFLYSPGTPTYAATTDVTVVLQFGPDRAVVQ